MEIWRQTEGRITHFVTGLGTSGTFMGVTRRLKELNPAIQCISMQPDGPLHGLEGLKHMPTALVPGIYDPDVADGQVDVATEDAHQMVLRLAREEGFLVGVSSGANLVAAMKVAGEVEGRRRRHHLLRLGGQVSVGKFLAGRQLPKRRTGHEPACADS